MTKRERRKICLKAAEYFTKPEEERLYGRFGRVDGFCDYCTKFRLGKCCNFEEYQLFNPENTPLYWFENQENRINALLLAAEIAK